MKPEIIFDEASHTYLVDGVEVPSVTTILKPLTDRGYGKINPSVLEYAANRGKAVHEALELYDLGGELEGTPETEGYIRAYLDWQSVYRPKWIGVEQIVFCKEWWYIGTLDRIGYLNGTELAVVDIKTSTPTKEAYVAVCLQTIAYAMAYESYIDIKADFNKINRYGLFLMKDGKYRLLNCKEYEGTNHFDSLMAFGELRTIHRTIDKLLETKRGKK